MALGPRQGLLLPLHPPAQHRLGVRAMRVGLRAQLHNEAAAVVLGSMGQYGRKCCLNVSVYTMLKDEYMYVCMSVCTYVRTYVIMYVCMYLSIYLSSM